MGFSILGQCEILVPWRLEYGLTCRPVSLFPFSPFLSFYEETLSSQLHLPLPSEAGVSVKWTIKQRLFKEVLMIDLEGREGTPSLGDFSHSQTQYM